jgi:hypothetical protein
LLDPRLNNRAVGHLIPVVDVADDSGRRVKIDQALGDVEEQLGLTTTDLDGLRAFARGLPFEPSMSLLGLLAGRVEAALSSATRQLELAESFGRNELTASYSRLVRNDPKAYVFGPQSLYTLMRVLIDAAYDAPSDQALTTNESGEAGRTESPTSRPDTAVSEGFNPWGLTQGVSWDLAEDPTVAN